MNKKLALHLLSACGLGIGCKVATPDTMKTNFFVAFGTRFEVEVIPQENNRFVVNLKTQGDEFDLIYHTTQNNVVDSIDFYTE